MSLGYEEIVQYIQDHEEDLDVDRVIQMTLENTSFNTIRKMSIFHLIPRRKMISYMQTKPERYEDIIRNMRGDDLKQVLMGIDDDTYKTKILATSNLSSVRDFLPYIEDEFYKKLVFKSVYDVMQEKDALIEMIDSYQKWKDLVMHSEKTEQEKVDMILGLENDDMKQAMLPYIKERENRDSIIQSMKREIDPEIEEYVSLCQKMIRSYFEDGLSLTEEQKEKMQIVLQTTNVKYSGVLVESQDELEVTRGISDFTEKQILVHHDLQDNPMSVIHVLLHEYAHMFSNANFLKGERIYSKPLEEGMSDTFADRVIQHFFDEKQETYQLKNGQKLSRQSEKTFKKGYGLYNAWVKSILYAKEKEGKADSAIAQYFLGDQKSVIQELHWSDYVRDKEVHLQSQKDSSFQLQYSTRFLSLEKLYQQFPEAYQQVDFDSLYAEENFILTVLDLQHRLQEKGIDVAKMFDDRKAIDASIIAQEYYGDRKIYDVPSKEYLRFVSLIDADKGEYDSPFAVGYDQYIDHKFEELTEEEIAEYSSEILKSGITLIRASENLKPKTCEVLQKAMDHELEKSKRIERLDDFEPFLQMRREIDSQLSDTFSRQASEVGTELYQHVRDFDRQLIENLNERVDEYRRKQKRIDEVYEKLFNRKSLGNKLLEGAKKLKVRVGEVLAKAFSFEKDMEMKNQDTEDPKL